MPITKEERREVCIKNLGSWIGRIPPMLGKHHSEETKKIMSEKKIGYIPWNKGKEYLAIQGKNHWHWKKDRSQLIKKDQRNDSAYKDWMRNVKRRDKNICQLKDKNCSGYHIAHHIRPWKKNPELRYQLKNGITLCQAHHPRKRAEEEILIPKFEELIKTQE